MNTNRGFNFGYQLCREFYEIHYKLKFHSTHSAPPLIGICKLTRQHAFGFVLRLYSAVRTPHLTEFHVKIDANDRKSSNFRQQCYH